MTVLWAHEGRRVTPDVLFAIRRALYAIMCSRLPKGGWEAALDHRYVGSVSGVDHMADSGRFDAAEGMLWRWRIV